MCLWPIDTSSITNKSVWSINLPVASAGDMLQVDCSCISIGTLQRLCNVLPSNRSVAAIPDKAVARAIFLFFLTAARIRFIVWVFPVPPLASNAIIAPSLLVIDFITASNTCFWSSLSWGYFVCSISSRSSVLNCVCSVSLSMRTKSATLEEGKNHFQDVNDFYRECPGGDRELHWRLP